MSDIRFALRTFSKNPAVVAATVVALGLGIGASSMIFSVVNAVLLRPLPYRQPGRLVMVWERIVNFGAGLTAVPAADYADFRDQNRVFESIAALEALSFNLSGASEPSRVKAARVSHAVWRMLGVEALEGRVFGADEDQYGGAQVAVVSYGLWQRQFGGDARLVGRAIRLDDRPYTVIGIMPREFLFPPPGTRVGLEPAELWIPFQLTPAEIQERGIRFDTPMVARLKPGVTLSAADDGAKTIAQRIYQTHYPPRLRGAFQLSAAVTWLNEEVVGNVRRALWILLGAVGCVLSIACANVANLLLARAAGRSREVAIRAALGAGRARIARQLLVESVMLALAGGTAGALLATWGAQVLVRFGPPGIPRLEQTRMDWVVLGFTVAVSILTGLLFGLAPVVEASRVDLSTALKEGGRGTSGRSLLGGALVAAEIGLALVLLVGAGLLGKSLLRATGADAGLRRENVLTLSMSLPQARYDTGQKVDAFSQSVLERVTSLPGVESAGLGTGLPMGARSTIMFSPEGRAPSTWGRTLARNTLVAGDYFRALGIPLKRGRLLGPGDVEGREPAVVINEMMAARFWPGEEAVGKRVKWGSPQSPSPYMTIVGVVGDVKQDALDAPVEPAIYMAYRQRREELPVFGRRLSLAVRTRSDPAALVQSVRREIAGLDAELPLYQVRTMDEALRASVAPRRFQAALVGLFAALALLLAAIGVYGVVSCSVQQRTREIGIRIALGAEASDVLRMVLRQGMALVLGGLAAGAAAAAAVTRVLRSLLFEVSATDPVVFAAVSLLLAASALAACWLPAWRATRVDPLVVLRDQ